VSATTDFCEITASNTQACTAEAINEKKTFHLNLVFGCVSPGLGIFRDILGV